MDEGSGWEQPSLEDGEQLPEGKACERCREWKSLSAFRSKGAGRGRYSVCKACRKSRWKPESRVCAYSTCETVFVPTYRSMIYHEAACGMSARAQRNRPAYLDAGEKWCPECQQMKPLDAFSWAQGGRTAKLSWCKQCVRDVRAARKREALGLPLDANLHTISRTKPEGAKSRRKKYITVKRVGHHRATSKGWVLEHIIVAEEKYGFPIPLGMTVHHLNDDGTDNRPENLELRVGPHGYHGDIVPTLLARSEERALAIAVLAAHPVYRAEMLTWLRDTGHIAAGQCTEGIQPAA
jgi:hypothetical protein